MDQVNSKKFILSSIQPPSIFVGREKQLDWLERMSFPGDWRNYPLVVCGAAGTGKTTLLAQFFANRRPRSPPRFGPTWVFAQDRSASELIDEIERRVRNSTEFSDEFGDEFDRGSRTSLIIDGADGLSDPDLMRVFYAARNWKRVAGVFITLRRKPDLDTDERAPVLELTELPTGDARRLFAKLVPFEIPKTAIEIAGRSVGGNPLAIETLAEILKTAGPKSLDDVLRGHFYDLAAPQQEILQVVQPKIILANDVLLEELKRHPHKVHELTSRKFEELLADILKDMGWEVELTKATRDGGRDILGYIDTGIRKILCLVEAKKYRQDRKIGVEMVRTLYGTLCHYQANSAMLVTTSSFAKDARDFQKQHEWQLDLREYGDVVKWIEAYKAPVPKDR